MFHHLILSPDINFLTSYLKRYNLIKIFERAIIFFLLWNWIAISLQEVSFEESTFITWFTHLENQFHN